MSTIYYEGRKYFEKEDYAKAYEIFCQGDKEGDVYCSFWRAYQLWIGYGVDKNESLANSIFERVFPVLKDMAEAGDALAQIAVCVAYHRGYIVKKNYKKAFYWCKKAAEQGNALAQAGLAFRYEDGRGTEKSIDKAIYWYEKAIEGGNIQATVSLADIYYFGENIERDYGKAFPLYFKAAQNGDEYAQFRLGVMYENGEGVEQDYEQAFLLFSKAAEAGDVFAQFKLSLMYENGEGVEKSPKKSFEWILRAAEQDPDYAHIVGLKYQNGEGTERSIEKAIYWYEKGFYSGEYSADCAYDLGWLYDNEDTSAQSLKMAVFWYKKGALKGSVEAQEALGNCYLNGRGVKRNVEKANYWLKQSLEGYEREAENGVLSAMLQVAEMWRDGKGCDANPERSNFWYKKYVDCLLPLAEKGDEKAQRSLGYAYQWGFVELSFQKAEYWYNKASMQGDKFAKLWLAEIYRDGSLGHRETQKAITLFQELKKFSAIGKIYAYGEGVQINFDRAEFWYNKAVETGDPVACLLLSLLYRKHKKSDKYKGSIKLLESITADKNWGGHAYQELANYYNEGLGVEKNPQMAKELNRKDFEFQKQHFGGAEYHYFFGWGTKKNYKKAFKEFLRTPEFGATQYYIGLCYAEGKGVAKDFSLAKKWYEKAASQGVQEAILALGEMYYLGRGVEQDYEQAVELFERSAEVKSYAEPNYYLGDCYHHGLGVKPNWYKAKGYYERAISLGYNCEYALEMVKIDLGEFRRITEIERYARDLAKLNLMGDALKDRIVHDLKKDFGECWDYLKENAQIALTSGILTYVTFVSMGDEFCKQLDFSAVIVNFAKALEVELAEFFYRGYILYLKKKKISPAVFPADSIFLNVTKSKNEEIGREYQDENEIRNFRLGGLKFIIDDKFEIMPSLEVAQQVNYSKGRSDIYRRRQMGYMENIKYGVRTIDKHMAAYANELFDKSVFSTANRKKEIVNYLIDLSNSVGELAFQYRNPAAHGDIMDMQKASACGDYIIKVRKLIYGLLSKIKKKYRKGYVGS